MTRIIYFFILIVSFGPSLVFLALGVISSPVLVYNLIESEFTTLIPLLLVIGGIFGFRGVTAVYKLSLESYEIDTPTKRLIIYLLLGTVTSSFLTYVTAHFDWKLAMAMFLPVPATGYLVYRNRHCFCKLGGSS